MVNRPFAGDPFAPGATRRLAEPEQMDAAGVDERQLIRALRFIRRINNWLGYNKLLGQTTAAMIADMPDNRPVRILDVATGSADAYEHVAFWVATLKKKIDFVALDLHERTLSEARRFTRGDVPLVRGDALALPFDDGAFDVVITSMFLHHLPDELAAAALREMARVARHGVLAADLLRERAAYRWITLFTLFSHPMVKHDARVSVRQAFTIAEAEAMAQAAGLSGATVTRHFGHRFVLAYRSRV